MPGDTCAIVVVAVRGDGRCEIAGRASRQAAAAAAKVQEACGADILLTRSEKGMSLFPVDGEPIHLATVAQNVFDVSGAGDTVVAVMAAAVAAAHARSLELGAPRG